ncbi:MAG: sigma-70 family RNA polymerase sigma factor [Parvibaculaceae bacterium]
MVASLLSNSVGLLDRESELDCIERWRKEACPQARERLLLAYQPLVERIARFYHRRAGHAAAVQLVDLCQEGNIGLLAALDRFDPSLGHRFGTYAQWWIAANIRASLRDLLQARRRREEAGVSGEEESLPVRFVSLDAKVSDEGDADFLDQLSDENATARAMVDAHYESELRGIVEKLLDGLDETLRRVVIDRFMGERARPRVNVAADLGMSLHELRSAETLALKRLKNAARLRGLSPFDLQAA